MPKVSAPEDICNLSLDLLKQSPLVNITTPTMPVEYIFQRWYDTERQAALRAHPWKFAITRVTLTPNPTTVPAFGYTYAYDLPNDFIRMVSLGDDYLGDMRMEHVLENGQILTPSGSTEAFPNVAGVDVKTLFLRYVYDCADLTKFDSLFVKYFALQMAVDLSTKFGISAALGTRLEGEFEKIDTMAKSVNGQDAPIKRIQQSKILTKRRGLPGGIFASKYTIFDS